MMVMLALLLTGLVSVDEAFSGFSSPAVITVWAIYIISASLTFTGIADFIGNQIGKIPGIKQESRLILGIMVTVGVMSAFINNIGATAVLAAILSVLTNCLDMDEVYQAIEWKSVFLIAGMLPIDADPRAFVMGVGIAASNSFMFPIGHQASVLVYGPGGYRFFGYTKVGLPLAILIWVLMVIFLPIFWPFTQNTDV